MASVVVVGAGLAGLAATAVLAESGFDIDVYEARPYPGGRATSYPLMESDGRHEVIDNCQHILLRCCTNLLDFYRRLGVSGQLEFHRKFFWIERGGRTSTFRAGKLPAPAHFTGAFLRLKFLSAAEKWLLGRAMLALVRDHRRSRADLGSITMLEWLREQSQSDTLVERFWRQILVSAVNEELDRMAASHGFQVFLLGFLATSDSYEMAVPEVPLGELYAGKLWARWPNVRFHYRAPVNTVNGTCRLQNGDEHRADYYLLAVPFERAASLCPVITVPPLEHSPITSVHLWFDRSVTELPHATLLDSPLQWMFNKGAGRQLQVVVSASRDWIAKGRAELIELTVSELGTFLEHVRGAGLVKARVVKEVRATIAVRPGLDALRPAAATTDPSIFLAGDWTQTGWPSTMEGAVRSGYLAAEAISTAAGCPRRFLVPEINDRSSVPPRVG
jgi:zeta-carotene desaturase